MSLIVTNPFGGHAKGHHITAKGQIAAVLASDHHRNVVQINDGQEYDENEPEAVTAPAPKPKAKSKPKAKAAPAGDPSKQDDGDPTRQTADPAE